MHHNQQMPPEFRIAKDVESLSYSKKDGPSISAIRRDDGSFFLIVDEKKESLAIELSSEMARHLASFLSSSAKPNQ